MQTERCCIRANAHDREGLSELSVHSTIQLFTCFLQQLAQLMNLCGQLQFKRASRTNILAFETKRSEAETKQVVSRDATSKFLDFSFREKGENNYRRQISVLSARHVACIYSAAFSHYIFRKLG